jgi:hypothetical protein
VFCQSAMFAGYDTGDNNRLPVTGGTAADKLELTGTSVENASAATPHRFPDLDGKVLFDGTGANGKAALRLTHKE